jgi:hypothetical protein
MGPKADSRLCETIGSKMMTNFNLVGKDGFGLSGSIERISVLTETYQRRSQFKRGRR